MIDEERADLTKELIEQAEGQIAEQTKRIDFYITEYSIELLALKMRNGDFRFALPAGIHMGR